MRYFLLFFALLIPCTGFLSYFICSHCRAHVEGSLSKSARKALDKASLQGVKVEFDHLDAKLTGSVENSADRKKATALIAGLDGARLLPVNNGLLASGVSVAKPALAKPKEPKAPVLTAPKAVTPAPKTALRVKYDAEEVVVHGRVPNEATKQKVMASIKGAKPNHTVNDQLVIEPRSEVPTWEEGVGPALQNFLPAVEQGEFLIDGDGVVLTGTVPTEDIRGRLVGEATEWLGSASRVTSRLAVVTPEPDAEAKQMALVQVFKNNALYFASGSKTIETEDIVKLRKIAESIKATPGLRLFVGGYADKSGNPEANRRLSLARATHVKDQLVKLGVDQDSLVVESFGAEEMSVDEAWKSRRVELSIQK